MQARFPLFLSRFQYLVRPYSEAHGPDFQTLEISFRDASGVISVGGPPPAEPHAFCIKLNRPRKKNAFNQVMYEELMGALHQASGESSCRVVFLTGSGDFYSSGNDLANFSRIAHPLTIAKQSRKLCHDFVDSFVSCTKPIVCAVNGPAIGIAATTLGLVDFVVAAKKATFHTPFKALGQAPEGCSSHTFPTIMGATIAEDILERGRKFSATEGKEWGFVDTTQEANAVVETALMEVDRYLAMDSVDKRLTPARVHDREILQAVNNAECDVLERAWVSEECFSALSAFLLSRKQAPAAYMLQLANATRPLWDSPR